MRKKSRAVPFSRGIAFFHFYRAVLLIANYMGIYEQTSQGETSTTSFIMLLYAFLLPSPSSPRTFATLRERFHLTIHRPAHPTIHHKRRQTARDSRSIHAWIVRRHLSGVSLSAKTSAVTSILSLVPLLRFPPNARYEHYCFMPRRIFYTFA